MAAPQLIITDAGRAAAVTAAGDELSVNIAEVGIGTGQWTPTAAATALVNELKRIPASGSQKSTPTSVTVGFQDNSSDVYTCYEIGFYLDDGTLFAIYASSDTVVGAKSAPLKLLWGLTMVLSSLPADSVSVTATANFLPPAASTTVPGIVTFATDAEAYSGTNSMKAVSPAGLNYVVGALTGMLGYFPLSSAPDGWIKANGTTIGSASSGATGRANADTLSLFTLLWTQFSNAQLPIQTSAGAGSTRGASAAADFAANKRLPVIDLRGEFIRSVDDGRGVDWARTIGSAQTQDIQSHAHSITVTYAQTDTQGGSQSRPYGETGATTGATGGAETRPRNVALLACLHL